MTDQQVIHVRPVRHGIGATTLCLRLAYAASCRGQDVEVIVAKRDLDLIGAYTHVKPIRQRSGAYRMPTLSAGYDGFSGDIVVDAKSDLSDAEAPLVIVNHDPLGHDEHDLRSDVRWSNEQTIALTTDLPHDVARLQWLGLPNVIALRPTLYASNAMSEIALALVLDSFGPIKPLPNDPDLPALAADGNLFGEMVNRSAYADAVKVLLDVQCPSLAPPS